VKQPHKRIYAHPPVDGTDEELELWVSWFVEALLGPATPGSGEPEEVPQPN